MGAKMAHKTQGPIIHRLLPCENIRTFGPVGPFGREFYSTVFRLLQQVPQSLDFAPQFALEAFDGLHLSGHRVGQEGELFHG